MKKESISEVILPSPIQFLHFVKTGAKWEVSLNNILKPTSPIHLKVVEDYLKTNTPPTLFVVSSPIGEEVLSKYTDTSELKVFVSIYPFEGAILLTKKIKDNEITYPYKGFCDNILSCWKEHLKVFQPTENNIPLYPEEIYITKLVKL